MTTHRSNVLRLAAQTGLIDPWQQRHHPDHAEFSTYFRGTKRIAAILCTPTLLTPHVRAFVGYAAPYNWLVNSDHRAIVLDLEEQPFFGCATDPLPALNLRGIRTNDRKQQVRTFIQHWYQHESNNVFSLMKKVDSDSVTDTEIEKT